MKRERTYVLLPVEEVTDKMIEKCIQTSRETLRLSNDGKLALLKWATIDGKPSCMPDYNTYSNNDILIEMQTDNWKMEDIY